MASKNTAEIMLFETGEPVLPEGIVQKFLKAETPGALAIAVETFPGTPAQLIELLEKLPKGVTIRNIETLREKVRRGADKLSRTRRREERLPVDYTMKSGLMDS